MTNMIIDKIKSSSDNLELELAYITSKGKPKGIVQISHGMTEHKERYFDFMNYLANNGYIAVIHDHRGHGASVKNKEDLGYFYTDDINYIVNDLEDVTKYIKNKFPNLKLYMFSHSMGTLVARNYIKKYDEEIDKLIMCGPPTKNSLAPFGIFLAKISILFEKDKVRNNFLNDITFRNYGDSWLSKNINNKADKDELSDYVFTTNGFLNLYMLNYKAFKKKEYKVKNPNLQIFIIAGSKDKVIDNKKKFNNLITFLNEVGYKNIKSRIYPGFKHKLLAEEKHQIVYKDILDFIEKM